MSDKERRRLEAAGKSLLDATCPLVRKVHEAARELEAEGRRVLVIGNPGHVEVRGIVGDLTDYLVIEGPANVRVYEEERLGVVCQTTMPPDVVATICDEIRRLNPAADLRVMDTVCLPTRMRQQAVLDLLPRVEAVVVVGGRGSNNTRRLVELCRQNGALAFHVENASELVAEWFEGIETVGLTAGTSTLDPTIAEVERALVGMRSVVCAPSGA